MVDRPEKRKPKFTVWPEFGNAYLWVNPEGTKGLRGSGDWSSKVAKLENKISKKLRRRLANWQSYYEKYGFDDASTQHIDWVQFHREGTALAVELKQELGDEVRVIYEKAWEDPNRELNERREVLLDGQLVPVNTDEY
jgi:hypothetical protein